MATLRGKAIPPLVCAACALVVGAWFRSGGESSTRPTDFLGPSPTVEEIQARALANPFVAGRHGGEIRISIGGDIATLNRILAKDNTTVTLLGRLYESLFERDRLTNEHRPLLAREIPTGPDDPERRVWTFRLRDDVRWFDGVPVTARDVDFTFNRLIFNEQIPTSSREVFRLEVRDPATGEVRREFPKVEAIDDTTVRVTCPRPWGFILDTFPYSAIYPRHALERYVDEGTFNAAWPISSDPRAVIGCGPFRLDEVVPGERVVFVRNPDYFLKDEFGNRLPYVDRLVYQVIPSDETARSLFFSGELDLAGVSGRFYQEYRKHEEAGEIRIVRLGPALTQRFLMFNMNLRARPDGQPYVPPYKARWFRTREFRQAVSHAIDRESIRSLVFNNLAFVQVSPVSESVRAYFNPEVHRYPFDLDRARALLDSIDYRDRDRDGIREDPDGHPIEFRIASYANSQEYERIAVLLKEDLERIGIRMHYDKVEFNALVRQLSQSWDWEGMIMGLTGDFEPHDGANVWRTSGDMHMWNPSLQPDDPGIFDWERRIDEVFEELSTKFTPPERVTLSHEWQRIVSEESPFIYTVTEERMIAANTRLGNFSPSLYENYDIRRLFVLPEEGSGSGAPR